MPMPIVSTEEDLQSYDLRELMRNSVNVNDPKAERGWDVGRIIANYVIEQRQQRRSNDSITGHVQDEEELPVVVRQAVAMAASDGQKQLGLQSGIVTQLNSDQRYRHQVQVATMVFSSLLYPLSYMIYRLAGVENIQVFEYDKVMVIIGEQRFVFTHVWDEFAKESKKSVDEACREWFKALLNIDGVGGDNLGLSRSNPRAEATFGSKARITVFIHPALGGRSSLVAAIRIHGGSSISDFERDYVAQGRMPHAMAQFLIAAIKGKANIMISGGTDTGKTTFIRVCTRYFPKDCGVLTIEDGAELFLDQPGPDGKPWVPFVIPLTTVVSARTDIEQAVSLGGLVRNGLRSRPDRVIVGEARGAEAADMVKALTSGHDGSFTSIHADGGMDAINKGANLMTEDPRYTNNFQHALDDIQSAFDLVVHLAKFYEKRVVQEVVIVSKGNTMPIYEMLPSGGWKTNIDRLDNIPNPKLRRKLAPYFPDGLLPKTVADGADSQ